MGSIDPSSFGMHFAAISSGCVLNPISSHGPASRCRPRSRASLRSLIGDRPRTGRTGGMQRGEVWFAKTPGGDRPVLVLTRDPVADRIGFVVVAALTRTRRGLVSELELNPEDDGVPTECVVNFDNIHTLPRAAFRRRIVLLKPLRLAQACGVLRDAMGC